MDINDFRDLIASPYSFKSFKDWERKWGMKSKKIDDICNGFSESLTRKLKIEIDNDKYNKLIVNKKTLPEIKSLCKDYRDNYSEVMYLKSTSGFAKQYLEEIVPILTFIENKKEELKIHSCKFSVQEKGQNESSYDSIIFDEQEKEIFKIECTCFLDSLDYSNNDSTNTVSGGVVRRIFNILYSEYNLCSYYHGIRTVKESIEYIKNHDYSPNDGIVYTIDQRRIEQVIKIKKSFDRKNNNDVYNQWNGDIVLLINWELSSCIELDETSLAEIKKHIEQSGNKFSRGVYLIESNNVIKLD